MLNTIGHVQRFAVAGYSAKSRVAVNLYQLDAGDSAHKLALAASCHLDVVGEALPAFTLTSPAQNRLLVNVFPWFREKGELLSIYQYDLEPLMHLAQPDHLIIKPEALVHKICLLQNYYLVKAVHQEGDDLYICYSGYVKFEKEKKVTDCQVSSHVWIYNISLGYNRNIIDLHGSLLHISVKCDWEHTRADRYLEIV